MGTFDRNQLEELDRAIEIGREVYYSLKHAEEKLNRAMDFGAADMLFANSITSSIKHRKIAEANKEIERARLCLQSLNRHLDRTVLPESLSVQVSEIGRFADIFFASRIMDVYYQDKINDALDQIEKSKEEVKKVVQELKKYRSLEQNVVAEV